MKKHKKVMFAALLVALLLFLAGKAAIENVVRQVQGISVSMPDLSNVPDGDYMGEHSIPPVHVKVEVSVHNHQVTNVKILRHDNGLGRSAEKIVSDVVAAQTLDVDTVSGATVSSKRILKAVENALKNQTEGQGGSDR